MNPKRPGRASSSRGRRGSRYVTTRSGRALKVHRTIGERWTARNEAKARRKVERMRGLPKSRLKRVLWRLHPQRLAAYWFSRDGGIMALKVAGIALLVIFVLTMGVFAYFRKDLPNIKDISGSNLGGSISYYDRTGQTLLWEDYDAVKRVPVKSSDMSQFIKDATVAVEDRDFYNHRGFDIRGIARAAFTDVIKRGTKQGGSTITQQLVKLTQDFNKRRSLALKMKELILAIELERSYTKDDILTGYLNAAPYGSVDYGVQAAASDYFHTSAKDLTLAQAAMLAAIPKSPAYYSPYSPYFEKEAFLGRQRYILDVMVQRGKITKAQAEEAKKVDVLAQVQPQQTKYAGIRSPYFVLAAKNELTRRFVPSGGEGSAKIGGWKVTTTLDVNLQNLAEQQVQKGLAQVKRQGGDSIAFAAQDVKTGQMVALIGGVDFNNPEYGQINYAQTPLPPGSSFKPYDYTALINNSNSAGAGSVLYDVQQALPNYPCTNKTLPPPRGQGNCLQNYDFRYPGPLTLRYALGGSRNVPAVKAMLINGVDKTIKTAEAMGLRSGYKCYADEKLTKTTQCYGAAAIGDGAYLQLDEHVNGFATLSRLGTYLPKTYILKIENASGKVLPDTEWKQPKGEQAVKSDAAYIVANILSDPNASYFPAGQKIHRYKGWNFGLKTGTTNDAKDGWLMGFSTKYAVGVWVGHHTRQKAMSGFMENMTRPIWNGWMTAAHDGVQPVNWTEPSSIQKQPAYVITSHVGIGSVEPSPATDIYPSWYKPKTTATQSSVIDKVSNKLATNCTPALAKQTVGGNRSADHFSIDTFYGSGAAANSNTSTNDDVHSCNDEKPQITLTVGNGSGTCEESCTISAAITPGTHPFDDPKYPQFPGTVNFSVNGQVIKTITTASGAPLSFTYTPTSNGNGTVTAQVIDSVLYDASDSTNVTFSAGDDGGISFSADKVGPVLNFSWSGGSGPYTVYRSNGTPVGGTCNSVAGNSCSSTGSGGSFYVQDSSGNKSSEDSS